MSSLVIQRYLNELQDLRKVSGTTRESVVREVFKDLLLRVTTVSVRTVEITQAMKASAR